MVTIDEAWKTVVDYSDSFSKIARQLAFGVAVICWFFKNDDTVTFPPAIYLSLFFIVLYFSCDALQYFTGAFIRRKKILAVEASLERHKKKWNGRSKFAMPDSIDDWPYTFWIAKLVLLILSFIALSIEFIYRML